MSFMPYKPLIDLPDLYDCRSGTILRLPEMGVHLRNHDFFM